MRTGNHLKNVTVYTVSNHIKCLKWRQSQNGTLKKQTVTSRRTEVVPYGPIELRRGRIIQKSRTTYIEAALKSRSEEGQEL